MLDHGRPTPERLGAFSDGVFAVIITIMVLELKPPNMVKPTIRSLSVSISAFRNPRVSEIVIARKTEAMGNLARRYGIPRCFASVSLSPIRASSGSVNKQNGTWRPVVTRLLGGANGRIEDEFEDD
jgi:hypothetical protein